MTREDVQSTITALTMHTSQLYIIVLQKGDEGPSNLLACDPL